MAGAYRGCDAANRQLSTVTIPPEETPANTRVGVTAEKSTSSSRMIQPEGMISDVELPTVVSAPPRQMKVQFAIDI